MLAPSDLRVPPDCDLMLAADTGTFMSALVIAVAHDYHAYVLAEFPNYRYVSDQIELNDVTLPEWTAWVVSSCVSLGASPVAWADPNTQFRAELRRHGLRLLKNAIGPETRVTVAREYFHNHRVHLAPWLEILPYELENAKWPEESTASGKYMRLRKADHTLVCLEHLLSRRPRGALPKSSTRKPSFLETYLAQHRTSRGGVDVHLGSR